MLFCKIIGRFFFPKIFFDLLNAEHWENDPIRLQLVLSFNWVAMAAVIILWGQTPRPTSG